MGGISTSKKVWLVSMVACLVMAVVRPGATQAAGSRDDLGQKYNDCWAALSADEECNNALMDALKAGRPELTGSPCCQASHNIPDDCWPYLYPFDLIYNACHQNCSETPASPPAHVPGDFN